MNKLRITFDISKTATGVAWEINQKTGTATINFDKSLNNSKLQFLDIFEKIGQHANPQDNENDIKIIFETPLMPFCGAKGFGTQKEVLGIIKGWLTMLYNDFWNYQEVQASQWKKYYPFEKNSNNSKDKKELKEQSIIFAKELFNQTIKTDDEADAFLMLQKFETIWEDKIQQGKNKKSKGKSKK